MDGSSCAITSNAQKANPTEGTEVEHVVVRTASVDRTLELAEPYRLRVLKGDERKISDAISKDSFDSYRRNSGILGRRRADSRA
jgi:hypothetical protein